MSVSDTRVRSKPNRRITADRIAARPRRSRRLVPGAITGIARALRVRHRRRAARARSRRSSSASHVRWIARGRSARARARSPAASSPSRRRDEGRAPVDRHAAPPRPRRAPRRSLVRHRRELGGRPAGRSRTCRSVSRTEPICVLDLAVGDARARAPRRARWTRRRCRGRGTARRRSPARACPRGTRAPPPAARRSPRGPRRRARRTTATNASRLAASRTADVAADPDALGAERARTPGSTAPRTALVRASAPGRAGPSRRPRSPRRVITMSRASSAGRPRLGGRLDAPSSRHEFVPWSIAATAAARVPRRGSARPARRPSDPTTSSPPAEVVRVVGVQALQPAPRATDPAPTLGLGSSLARARPPRPRAPLDGRRERLSSSIPPFSSADPPSDSIRDDGLRPPSGQVSQYVVGNGVPSRRAVALRITSGCPPVQRATTTKGVVGSRPSCSRTATRSAAAELAGRPPGTPAATCACARWRAGSRPGAPRSAA